MAIQELARVLGGWEVGRRASSPEPWPNGGPKESPRYAHVHFGGGQRLCIGNTCALVKAAVLIAMIAQGHRCRLAADRRVEPHAALTLRRRHGMPMALHAR